jgi:hypothetical protein
MNTYDRNRQHLIEVIIAGNIAGNQLRSRLRRAAPANINSGQFYTSTGIPSRDWALALLNTRPGAIGQGLSAAASTCRRVRWRTASFDVCLELHGFISFL